jgi:hypothetical protein
MVRWTASRLQVDKENRRDFDGILAYAAWHIWSERNARIFQSKYITVGNVSVLIREAVNARERAFGRVVNDDGG